MFQSIRSFFLSLHLRFKPKEIVSRLPVSLSQAEKVGILFPADITGQNDCIQEFAEQLKKQHKEVQLLAYISKRDIGFNYPFPLITDKDCNWYGKPGGGTTGYFMRHPFDLLINFSTEECAPLDYIAACSPSRFRIAFREDAHMDNYELILIPRENKDISNLIQNLETYLK